MCEDCKTVRPAFSRRSVMAGTASLLAASSLSVGRVRAEQPQTPESPQNVISPSEALDRLMQGNARYAAGECECEDYTVGRAARAVVQYPIVAVLSCSDSRVAPELAFDQSPGDVFVVRLAGNFLNDDGFASLEYAVKFLGAPLVMVLGHTNCGAMDAARRSRSRMLDAGTRPMAAERCGQECSASMTGWYPTLAWSWAWPVRRQSLRSSY
ncbi:MAG TPA: carbonic anhydrase [Methyloceanibacter sp.]|nr:carbonic anhydrase [Methyloceanibacter sp.]